LQETTKLLSSLCLCLVIPLFVSSVPALEAIARTERSPGFESSTERTKGTGSRLSIISSVGALWSLESTSRKTPNAALRWSYGRHPVQVNSCPSGTTPIYGFAATVCQSTANSRKAEEVRNCSTDEGRPSESACGSSFQTTFGGTQKGYVMATTAQLCWLSAANTDPTD
jgi:hypothetical protein